MHRSVGTSRRVLVALTAFAVTGGAVTGTAVAVGGAGQAGAGLHAFRGDAGPEQVTAQVTTIHTTSVSATGLTIVAGYDASITSDPNAAAIEAGIEAGLHLLEAHITNPVTVHITFVNDPTGLAGTASTWSPIPYPSYRSDLQQRQHLSTNDRKAISTLPVGSTNPVNGDPGVYLVPALQRAIGEPNATNPDATMFLNLSLMNLSRSGPQDPNKYDLQSVIQHEGSEVLGAGGGGSLLDIPLLAELDLFRYSAPGVRSFTQDPNATAYLSIDGGTTNLGFLDNLGFGDYGDWNYSQNGVRQVQDAFGPVGELPGTLHLDMDTSEWTAVDVIGWNLNATAFINDLLATVNALQAKSGPKNALTKTLNAAKADLSKNQPKAAASAMKDFDTTVKNFLATGALTSAQAKQLLTLSANIESIIGV